MAFYIRSCWKINPGCGSASDGPGCRHRIRYRSCWRHSNTGLSRISVHSWCPPAHPCAAIRSPEPVVFLRFVVGGNIHVGAGGLIVGGKGKRLPCGHFAGPGQQTHQVLGGFKGERGGVGFVEVQRLPAVALREIDFDAGNITGDLPVRNVIAVAQISGVEGAGTP